MEGAVEDVVVSVGRTFEEFCANINIPPCLRFSPRSGSNRWSARAFIWFCGVFPSVNRAVWDQLPYKEARREWAPAFAAARYRHRWFTVRFEAYFYRIGWHSFEPLRLTKPPSLPGWEIASRRCAIKLSPYFRRCADELAFIVHCPAIHRIIEVRTVSTMLLHYSLSLFSTRRSLHIFSSFLWCRGWI